MDPDQALKNARDALKLVRESSTEHADAACDLADAFEGLDAWLSNGGFLPEDWATAPRAK